MAQLSTGSGSVSEDCECELVAVTRVSTGSWLRVRKIVNELSNGGGPICDCCVAVRGGDCCIALLRSLFVALVCGN